MLILITQTGFALELDLALSERHRSTSDVTLHPVEQGVRTTDHVRSKPEELTVEALVSATPIIGGVPQSATTKTGRTVMGQGEYDPDRVTKTYQELLRLQASNELLTVKTGLKTYSNMILTEVSPTRDVSVGEALQVSLSFVGIRTVGLLTATGVFAKVSPNVPRAAPKKNGGTQAPTPVSPPVKDELKSTAYSFVEAAANLSGKL